MSLFQAFQQRGLSDLYSEREGIMSRECAEAMDSAMGTSLAAGRRSVIGFSKSGWLRNQRVLLGSQVRKEGGHGDAVFSGEGSAIWAGAVD